ncbi:MAG: hypothetical protein FWF78_01815 [Defluviitaleaceae bacterium]|nr:hypothetical protein [Defluviitaleaceae bacterium]
MNKIIDAVKNVSYEDIIIQSMKLPLVKVERENFLRKQFEHIVEPDVMELILCEGTIKAGVKPELLDKLAKASIKQETLRVTALSAGAGVPGFKFMAATVPADLIQFYAHVFRIAQKLAYIYGWQELIDDEETKNKMLVFLGVMEGVGLASKALMSFALEHGPIIGIRVAAKPLTKTLWYPILKSILRNVGVKITKKSVGNFVSKAVPVVGGVVSGGVSYVIYKTMANSLAQRLSDLSKMTSDEILDYFNKPDNDFDESDIIDIEIDE